MRKPRVLAGGTEKPAHESGARRADQEPIRREKTGFGCGFFGLVFIAGCGFLVMLVGGFLLPDWRANNRYLPTTCVVLDRRLGEDIAPADPEGRGGGPVYHPEIEIQYEVDGREYVIWTYDAVHMYSPDKAGRQAIVNGFKVGARYPCWYDPDRPEKAILVRGHAWVPYLLLVVPIVFLLVGGVGISRSLKNRGKPAS